MVGVFRKNIRNQCGGDNVSEAGMNQRLKKKKKKEKPSPVTYTEITKILSELAKVHHTENNLGGEAGTFK